MSPSKIKNQLVATPTMPRLFILVLIEVEKLEYLIDLIVLFYFSSQTLYRQKKGTIYL